MPAMVEHGYPRRFGVGVLGMLVDYERTRELPPLPPTERPP